MRKTLPNGWRRVMVPVGPGDLDMLRREARQHNAEWKQECIASRWTWKDAAISAFCEGMEALMERQWAADREDADADDQ